MGQPIHVEENPTTDSLVRLILLTVGFAILGVITIACLPKNTFAKMWGGMSAMSKTARDPHKDWAQKQLLKGRPLISYNNPAVQKTLDLPWEVRR